MLELRDIHAGYGRMKILHGVSLAVGPAEIVTVIGPNGAGKSTAFKVVMGFLRPEKGSVRFRGEVVTGLRAEEILRRGLAYVPQGRIVFRRMTVQENLEMGGYLERDRKRFRECLERAWEFFPILYDRRGQMAGTLSGGEQQMLAIGRALMSSPRMILLDEPSLGLSPKYVTFIFDKIQELSRAGVTLMLVEQNAVRALAIAHRGYVLELGRNRFEGTGP
ncbi:MAG: ABC transporter ATP-binding protein, partial [Nitrospinota bacterium]